MQTFLPYADFTRSAQALDNRRLGKQRVEVLQILNALTNPHYGWQNHPAVKMWRGCEIALCNYGFAICREWVMERKFKDTCGRKIDAIYSKLYSKTTTPINMPTWLGDFAFHISHQSNLIRKLPSHYRPLFGNSIPDNLPYVWPVK